MTLIDAVRKFMVEEHISDNRHISSVDDIKFAVTKAYHDLMLRTIPGHNYTVQNECIPWLTCEIEKFIKKEIKTKKEYNAEHEKLCNGFLAMLNSQLKDAGASQQLFGKAQKVVNMSLKYLYCFCDHQDYMKLFTFAHMPLDTYTLNWYYSNSSKDWEEKHTWSNLSADEYYNTGHLKNPHDIYCLKTIFSAISRALSSPVRAAVISRANGIAVPSPRLVITLPSLLTSL